MRIKGAKNLEKQLNKIGDKAKKEIDGKVSLEELFSQDFLQKHTSFKSCENLMNSLPIEFESQEDLDNMDKSKVDPIIKENTEFDNWDEFSQAAANSYAKKKLKKLFK